MRMIYKTLCDSLPHELDAEVEAYLAGGWKLYGNPYSTQLLGLGDSITPAVCQAVTREVDSEY